jgi:hypothetical protein
MKSIRHDHADSGQVAFKVLLWSFSAIPVSFPVALADVLLSCSHKWCALRICSGCRRPDHFPLCRLLYASGLDACLYRDKQKLNEVYSYKLIAA